MLNQILLGGNVKVGLDLSNYATKSNLKKASCVHTSDFVKKVYLASLKSDVDELYICKLKNVPTTLNSLNSLKCKVDNLDVDKLVSVPTDLSKLSDVVINEVVKKNVYD